MSIACSDRPLNNPYPSKDEKSNIYYTNFTEQPNTLDPARSYTVEESVFTAQIYEPPLQYHYLKRPYVLVPLTASEVPMVHYLDAGGNSLPTDAPEANIAYSVYDVSIQPGILYQPHPAFALDTKGQYLYHHLNAQQLDRYKTIQDFPVTGTRELTADDYVYEIKRLAHPQLQSPIFGVMSNYIVGLGDYGATLIKAYDQFKQKTPQGGFFDLRLYDFAGAEVLDKYHYRIMIKGKYPQFLYWLAMPFFGPVPWEADSFYSQPGMKTNNLTFDWYPIGTGAYRLTVNNPNRQLVLARNPNFHQEFFPEENKGPGAMPVRLPFIDQFVFTLEKESIPRWNKFLQGYYDQSGISTDSFDSAISFSPEGEPALTPAMQSKNLRLRTSVEPSVFYLGFNMRDDVVGGYSEKAKKLRQAIGIAVDFAEYISIFLNGRGILAQGPIPPDIFGYVSPEQGFYNSVIYDWDGKNLQRKSLAKAKQLLSEAGYPNGQDAKTGEPLVLNYDAIDGGDPDEVAKLQWMREQFEKLGIQLQIRATNYNRFQEKMQTGNAQIFIWGWSADYPDPENFLFLLLSKNGKVLYGGENAGNYQSDRYDQLFNTMKSMDNTPERQAIINQMIMLSEDDMPVVWAYYPKTFQLIQSWNERRKPSQLANNTLKYAKIDPLLRASLRNLWNKPVFWPIVAILFILILTLIPVVVRYWQKEHSAVRRFE